MDSRPSTCQTFQDLNPTLSPPDCISISLTTLTIFSFILPQDFNPSPPTEPPPITLALTGVSYIGAILSIIALIITIITYLGER